MMKDKMKQPERKRDTNAPSLTDQMILAMIESKLRPEMIYAFTVTERIVTEENAKFLTEEDLQEWDNAVEEYRHVMTFLVHIDRLTKKWKFKRNRTKTITPTP